MALNQSTELDTQVDAMLSPASQHVAELGRSLVGTGAEAWSAFKELQSTTSTLGGIGRSVATEAMRLKSDEMIPLDHRRRLAAEKLDTADQVVEKLNSGQHAIADRLESVLKEGVLPQPHKDPGQRALVRDELRTRFAGKAGLDLTAAMLKALGTNSAHDSELVGSFGESMMAGADAGDQHSAVKAEAVAKYLQRSDGTPRQVASRQALTEFQGRNIRGQLAAFQMASRLLIRNAR